MSHLRNAAERLAAVRHAADLDAIATELGFGPFDALDARTASNLGLSADARRPGVARGSGTLRALRFAIADGAAPRETVARLTARLGDRAPQMLWLVLAAHQPTKTLYLAAPASGGGARVVALAVEWTHVTDSDAETLAAMAGASGGVDLLVHHRWRELLGREALTRRFYRELERVVTHLASSAKGNAPEAVRREIALLHASRLLFLAFLEAKDWLDRDREYLRHRYDAQCLAGGDVHRRLLDPLFFGTLNTPIPRRAPAARALGDIPFLNGGLFARTPIEGRARALRFTDEAIGDLIVNVLGRYRVTSREQSTAWHEAAVDPEMLGRAFESLMASPERRATGAFYTPPELIERVTMAGLDAALAPRGVGPALLRAALDGKRIGLRDRAALQRALDGFRVLDPACGSGAFLVHLLERLATLARAAGDTRSVTALRRDLLTRSIFGVDVNPTAVWLCELRLWLAVVIDAPETDPSRVPPLPNLDRHVRAGDALAGAAFGAPVSASSSRAVTRLRLRYARATGCRKQMLARALDGEERRVAIAAAEHACTVAAAARRDLIGALRSRDLFAARIAPTAAQARDLETMRVAARDARRRLASLRRGAPLPFAFGAHFADAAANGGFDLIVGNPPWVRLHQIPPASREAFRRAYRSFRDAAWLAGAESAGATRGFGAQADLAALFVERSLALTRVAGAIALLVPSKLWRSLAGGGVRRVVRDQSEIVRLEDWSESRAAFDAVVYPSLLVARRVVTPDAGHAVHAAVHRRTAPLEWSMASQVLPLDATPGAPWLLLPPEARAAFDHLASAGEPFALSRFQRPLLGVKTGCNDAFVIDDGASFADASLLRPVLRGEHVRAWRAAATSGAIVWTHADDGAPLATLPRAARTRLEPWRRRLEARTDARHGAWWTLFRTESARHDAARVVWCDIGRTPRALVLPKGDRTVPLNTCYVARAATDDDALALAAYLNSPVAAAWLAAIAEPARGNYRRFLGWTVARLPLPRDWEHAVAHLAPLARRAMRGDVPDDATLTAAVIKAFRVRHADVAPLLVWCLR